VAGWASTALLTRGELALRFWGGVVGAGLGVPFLVQLLEVLAPGPGAAGPALLSSSAGLAGGLFLRHVVIAAGTKSPLSAAGMLFPALGPGAAGPAGGLDQAPAAPAWAGRADS